MQLAEDDKVRYKNEMKAWEEHMTELGREDLVRRKESKRKKAAAAAKGGKKKSRVKVLKAKAPAKKTAGKKTAAAAETKSTTSSTKKWASAMCSGKVCIKTVYTVLNKTALEGHTFPWLMLFVHGVNSSICDTYCDESVKGQFGLARLCLNSRYTSGACVGKTEFIWLLRLLLFCYYEVNNNQNHCNT